jgi:hypothetical protein
MKAYGSGGIALPFLTSTLDESDWFASHTYRCTLRGNNPVHIVQEVDQAHSRSGRYEKRKISCPYRQSNPDSSVSSNK